MFTYIVEVQWDYIDDKYEKDYLLLQGSSFADVTQTIENAYGNDLINVKIEILSDTLPRISEGMIEELKELNTF